MKIAQTSSFCLGFAQNAMGCLFVGNPLTRYDRCFRVIVGKTLHLTSYYAAFLGAFVLSLEVIYGNLLIIGFKKKL